MRVRITQPPQAGTTIYKRRGAASTILPKIYQVREIVKVTEHLSRANKCPCDLGLRFVPSRCILQDTDGLS